MNKKLIAALLTTVTATAGVASAQQDPLMMGPMMNWNYQHHASTVEEGYLRGVASAVQANGQATYANSLAAVNFAEANRKQIENSRLYVQVYLERREMVRAYLNKYGNHPPTKEQVERVAMSALPDRLGNDEYDAVTGKLVWPHILRDEAYAPFREKIDQLMVARTPDNSGDGSGWQREVAQLVDGMKRTLKQNIDSVTPQQYARAKWFLISLDYEARLAPGSAAPATPAQPAAVAADAAAPAATIQPVSDAPAQGQANPDGGK